MPTIPLPSARICLMTLRTVEGSASMCEPMGLRRTRSTSTHGEAAAARRASMEWQETPCARMTPFSLASESTYPWHHDSAWSSLLR
jgi:hypothetical protein